MALLAMLLTLLLTTLLAMLLVTVLLLTMRNCSVATMASLRPLTTRSLYASRGNALSRPRRLGNSILG
eukprot:720464-Pleurochrysis_carterae.AAC.1